MNGGNTYILFLIIFLPLVIMFLTVLINTLLGPFLKKRFKAAERVKVSVLIPARNEENNIGNCLESITKNDHPDFEVIVLDDNSSDNTYRIAEKYSENNNNIQCIKGKPLPAGWIGKTWACHQLSLSAKGDVLIFTDADNTYEKNAIANTVAYMQRFDLDFLSAFPEQRTQSFAEKLIIPMIDLIAYSFFILWSSYFVKLSIFIEANGQWLAVRKSSYKAAGGHEAVKDKIVEDTELGRLFKKMKMKTLTVAGKDIVYGKMYSSFWGIWQGLTKNLYGIAGYNPVLFFFLLFLMAYNILVPYSFFFWEEYFYILLIALIINILWRAILSLRFHQSSFFISVLLHPVSILLLIAIAINSYLKSISGKIEWKGRKINPGLRNEKK